MKPRICHLTSGDVWGGAENQVLNLLIQLNKIESYNNFLIVFNNGPLINELQQIGIPCHIIEEQHNSSLKIFFAIVNFLKKHQISLVHTHKDKADFLGCLAALYCGIPYRVKTVYGLTELYTGYKKIKSSLKDYLNIFIMKKFFSKIITVSPIIKIYLRRFINETKLVNIYCGIDSNKIQVRTDKCQIKENLHIDADHYIIGSVGRFVPVKGYNYLIKAAKLILRENSKVIFLLIGDGPEKKSLMEQAKKMNIEKHFRFTGFVNDLYSYMKVFDIFVLSSIHDCTPNVLLESMALGIPIVATKVGGVGEVLKHMKTGLLVEPKNEHVLAKACLHLLADKNLGKRIVNEANEVFQKRFLSERMAENTLKVYKEILSA